MPPPRGVVTTHITAIPQDNPQITSVWLSEPQVLELIAALTVALREKAAHADGLYHLALWKDESTGRVNRCQAHPPCAGGAASLVVVRPGRS